MEEADPGEYQPGFQGYRDLMHFKVREILLVSSLYDTYILGEDGLLAERLLSDYQELDITQPPRIVRVATP